MADSTLPLVQALLTKLKDDAPLNAHIGARVYTSLPENAKFPCAVMSVSGAPFDTLTTSGMSHDVQVTLFSRAHGAGEALELRSLVHDLLHNGSLVVAGFETINMRVTGPNRTRLMGDGRTWRSTLHINIKVTS